MSTTVNIDPSYGFGTLIGVEPRAVEDRAEKLKSRTTTVFAIILGAASNIVLAIEGVGFLLRYGLVVAFCTVATMAFTLSSTEFWVRLSLVRGGVGTVPALVGFHAGPAGVVVRRWVARNLDAAGVEIFDDLAKQHPDKNVGELVAAAQATDR